MSKYSPSIPKAHEALPVTRLCRGHRHWDLVGPIPFPAYPFPGSARRTLHPPPIPPGRNSGE